MPSYLRSSYTHKQTTASATWTINHTLGFRPGVNVAINYGGKLQVVIPKEVELVSNTQVVVRFSNPQTGEARLS
jgi:hypothetical protein